MSQYFRIKMRHFYNIFYDAKLDILHPENNTKLDEETLLKFTKDFARTQKALKKNDKEYNKFISNKKYDVEEWLKKNCTFKNNTFTKYFDDTNFKKEYGDYFPVGFTKYSFLDEVDLGEFYTYIQSIKVNYEKFKDKGNKYIDFKYITFYSTTFHELIQYKITYKSNTKITLQVLRNSPEEVSRETYEGTIEIINETLVLTAKNNKIYINTIFLLSTMNTLDNDALMGITVGVSLKNGEFTQLAKKIILSKYLDIYKNEGTNAILKLFLNEQQSLRIKKDDLKDLLMIQKSGKTEVTYPRVLQVIKQQMKDNKAILKDKDYINSDNEDSFYMPLIESYNLLESNIGRIYAGSITYRINMSMVEVFKKISQNKDSFEKLKDADFRVDITLDLVRYKHNIYFNSPQDLLDVFKDVEDLISSDKFSLNLILDDTTCNDTLQIKTIPEKLKSCTYYISRKDIIAQCNGRNPLENIITVFVKMGNKLALHKSNTQEFFYTTVDRGKQGLKDITSSMNTIEYYRKSILKLIRDI